MPKKAAKSVEMGPMPSNMFGCNACDDIRAVLNADGYCIHCAAEQGPRDGELVGMSPEVVRVLSRKAFPKRGAIARCEIVLCKLEGSATPFVTWWHNLESGGCSSGNYFVGLVDAALDYDRRVVAEERYK